MYTLSDRCARLREEAVDKRTYHSLFDAQRNVIIIAGIQRAKEAGKTWTEALAEGMALTLDKFMPVIIPGELIVGFNYGCREYFYPGSDDAGRDYMRRNGIPDDIIEDFIAHRGDYLHGFDRAPGPISPRRRSGPSRNGPVSAAVSTATTPSSPMTGS